MTENMSVQKATHAESIENAEEFWMDKANAIYWQRKPDRALEFDHSRPREWKWFPGGLFNTCENCLDVHVRGGAGDDIALRWDSPVTGRKEKYTYSELLAEVQIVAGILKHQFGIRKGDVVLIYLPPIPLALISMLAIVRLGAVHTVVFGGFSPRELAKRIDHSQPKLIISASCGIETNRIIPYKPLLDEAIAISNLTMPRVLMYSRPELPIWHFARPYYGYKFLYDAYKSDKSLWAIDCEPTSSQDPLYILYTSGTTGAPKGVLRYAGGHAVALKYSIKFLFGLRKGDVLCVASDVGWVVGTSYIVYAPLLAGITTIQYEGKPVGTPDPGQFWRLIEEYKVNLFFCAPTALRAIRKQDPQGKYFFKHNLRSLRALFLAGERSEPVIIKEYLERMAKKCAPGATVVDNAWSTETGSPITGIALNGPGEPHLMPKPGSAGPPTVGYSVHIVDEDGQELPHGVQGVIVLKTPLAPTCLQTLYKDPNRFYESYFKRFDGKGNWFDTGDEGIIDEDGYLHLLTRGDDVINVAAHRLSSGSMEETVASNPEVAECCVIGMPDPIKGQTPLAIVVRATNSTLSDEKLFKQLDEKLRELNGPIFALGGLISSQQAILPKTKSGKTLRRVLREVVEKVLAGDEKLNEIKVPATIEDPSILEFAKTVIKQWARRQKSKL